MSDEGYVDLETSEQVKGFLKAEEALGEKVVLRVLRTTWDNDNLETWCWFNGCAGCGEELRAGEEGFVLPRPLGDNPDSTYMSLQTYCSQTCVDRTIMELGVKFQRDIIVGYHVL